MEWVETTGKTLADALDRALDQLGVDERDVEYEVLDEPRAGLFGRMRGEARIRARVRPLSRDKPGETGRRRRGSGNGRDRRQREAVKSARPSGSERPAGPSGDGRSRPKRRRRSTGGRRRETQESTEVKTVDEEIAVEDQADMAAEFTRGLVDAFGAEADVATTIEDDENVLVEVTGEDLGLLVGPKGSTLAAVEELVRTVVQRGTAGGSARIHVDVGGYRAKRREALADFAAKVAGTVLDTDADKALEPMSASDRKVVHDTVAEIDGVETTSEGEEPRRRVVIRRA